MYERYRAYRQSGEQVAAAKQQLEALEAARKQAEDRVNQLQADPVEVEAAIRRIKGLIRPGEMVFRLKEHRPAQTETPGSESETHRTEWSN